MGGPESCLINLCFGWVNSQLERQECFHINSYTTAGSDSGGVIGEIAYPKTKKSNLFHHNFLQFEKQHSRYKAIHFVVHGFFTAVLQQQSRYKSLTNKRYWNISPNLTGW